jgi:hypothetical protein
MAKLESDSSILNLGSHHKLGDASQESKLYCDILFIFIAQRCRPVHARPVQQAVHLYNNGPDAPKPVSPRLDVDARAPQPAS